MEVFILKYVKKIIGFILIFTIVVMLNLSSTYSMIPVSNLVYEGIDVSNWQRYINYNQVKASGIEVVYIKASEGTTYKDPYFETNYQNAKANGLKVGFYHFLTARNTQQARAQAQFFASVISGKSPDCKLAMDYEQFYQGNSIVEINQIAQAFMERLQELTGKEVIVYSNLNDARNVFNSEISSRYPLWLAYWGDYNNLQNISSNWQIFEGVQYTNKGVVPGINGYVDRNRFTQNILLEECTECPSTEPPEPEEGQENGQESYYIVKSGDTLSSIANIYNTTVQQIVEINGISNPNLIFPGQRLRIPVGSYNTEPNEMGHIVYTVRRGDNLWNISRKYGTTVQEIAQLNNISNPNLIFPGQRLKIPKASNVSNKSVYYTVRRGDSLWRISRLYGVSVRYLANLNNIRNPNLIYVGQILKIK